MENSRIQQVIDIITNVKLNKKDKDTLRKEINDAFKGTIDIDENSLKAIVNALNQTLLSVGKGIKIDELLGLSGEDQWKRLGQIAANDFVEAFNANINGINSEQLQVIIDILQDFQKKLGSNGIQLFDEENIKSILTAISQSIPKASRTALKSINELDRAISRHGKRKSDYNDIKDTLSYDGSNDDVDINDIDFIYKLHDKYLRSNKKDPWEISYQNLIKFVKAYEKYVRTLSKTDYIDFQQKNQELADTYKKSYSNIPDVVTSLQNLLNIKNGNPISEDKYKPWAREDTLQDIKSILQGDVKKSDRPIESKVYRAVADSGDSKRGALDAFGAEFWSRSKATAQSYTSMHGDDRSYVISGTIRPVNPLIIDAGGAAWNDFDEMMNMGNLSELAEIFPDLLRIIKESRQKEDVQKYINEQAKNAGYDVVQYKNVRDSAIPESIVEAKEDSIFAVLTDRIVSLSGAFEELEGHIRDDGTKEITGKTQMVPEFYEQPQVLTTNEHIALLKEQQKTYELWSRKKIAELPEDSEARESLQLQREKALNNFQKEIEYYQNRIESSFDGILVDEDLNTQLQNIITLLKQFKEALSTNVSEFSDLSAILKPLRDNVDILSQNIGVTSDSSKNGESNNSVNDKMSVNGSELKSVLEGITYQVKVINDSDVDNSALVQKIAELSSTFKENEEFGFFNSTTGATSNFISGGPDGVIWSGKLSDVDANYKNYDTSVHNHPAIDVITASAKDLDTFIKHFDNFKKHIIIGQNELAQFDFSKITKEQLSELTNEYKTKLLEIKNKFNTIDDNGKVNTDKVSSLVKEYGSLDNAEASSVVEKQNALITIFSKYGETLKIFDTNKLNNILSRIGSTKYVSSRNDDISGKATPINIDSESLQQFTDKLAEILKTKDTSITANVVSPAEGNQIAQEGTLKEVLDTLKSSSTNDNSSKHESDTQQNDGQKMRTAIMQELAKYGTYNAAHAAGQNKITYDGKEVQFARLVSDYMRDFLGKSFDPSTFESLWKEAREKFYKFEPLELTKEDAINIIREKMPDNLLDGWFRDGDSEYKSKIKEVTMSDDELRNAALNIMWSNFKEFSGKDIGFKEFLNSEIPVYRGKNSEKYVTGDELLAFSFDENMAKKFGNYILKTLIKPIDTLGAFQTTAEAETLVYRNQIENRSEYQLWHKAMAGEAVIRRDNDVLETQTEQNNMTVLKEAVDNVTQAVEQKNKAFKDEETAVKNVVASEIYELSKLKDEVGSITDSISEISDGVSSIDSEDKMENDEDKNNRTSNERQADQKQALDEQQKIINELIPLYEKLGKAKAKSDENLFGETIASQAKQDYNNIRNQIKQKSHSLKMTSDVRGQLTDAYNTGRDNVTEAQRNKILKNLEAHYEKLGKLRAQVEFTKDNGKVEELRQLENTINGETEILKLNQQQNEELKKSLNLRAQSEYENEKKILGERQKYKDFKQEIKESQSSAKINKTRYAINRADETLANAMSIDGLTDDQIAKLEFYKTQIDKLKQKQDEIRKSDGIVTEEQKNELINQTRNVNLLTKEISELVAEYNKLSGDNIIELGNSTLANDSTLADYKQQLTDAVQATTDGRATITGFDATTKTLFYTIKTGKNEFTKYAATLRQLDNQFVSVQKDTKKLESPLDRLKRKMSEVLTYVGGSSIIYRTMSELRRGIQYVRDIDSALTELKKVTDETEEAYNRFLDTASKTASKVGSTIKEVVSSTADWARLGYSLEEAASLAESTSVLLNVSEFSSIEDATSALVSTMQAFGYAAKDSMHVVDVMNEIGNNYAISSDGIATALQDSASSLMAANNSYQEAVALIASANKVVNLCHITIAI